MDYLTFDYPEWTMSLHKYLKQHLPEIAEHGYTTHKMLCTEHNIATETT